MNESRNHNFLPMLVCAAVIVAIVAISSWLIR